MSETFKQALMNRRRSILMADVSSMQYADFIRVTKTSKPYRGTNAYPVGSRRYSHRHFVMNGDVVEVWDANLKMVEQYRKGTTPLDHWSRRRHLVNIYPDNTVEFISVWGIGDGMFLSNLLGGLVHSESRRSGTVFYPKNNFDLVHPVFKGLRVSLTDGSVHPDSQYKMIYRRIIPKERDKVLGNLEAQLKVARTMLSSMSLQGIIDMWTELRTVYKPSERQEVIRAARQNNHCLDVMIHMALESRRNYMVNWSNTAEEATTRIIACADSNKLTYLSAQPEAFKYIEREPFDCPTASWGIRIKVGDKFAERL